MTPANDPAPSNHETLIVAHTLFVRREDRMSENKSSDQLECERICKEVYTTTSAFYEQRKSEMAERDYGYKILNGPPLAGAPVLFLGYQPGEPKKMARDSKS
jgi:hypothetical protein